MWKNWIPSFQSFYRERKTFWFYLFIYLLLLLFSNHSNVGPMGSPFFVIFFLFTLQEIPQIALSPSRRISRVNPLSLFAPPLPFIYKYNTYLYIYIYIYIFIYLFIIIIIFLIVNITYVIFKFTKIKIV